MANEIILNLSQIKSTNEEINQCLDTIDSLVGSIDILTKKIVEEVKRMV